MGSRFQQMFKGAVDIYGGVRAAGRLLGISPSTVSRLYRGDVPDPKTASVVGAAVGVCPCCDQDWPSRAAISEGEP